MKRPNFAFPIASMLALLFAMPIHADELQVSPFEGSTLIGEHNSRFASLPILTEPMDADRIPTRIDMEGVLNSRIFQRPDGVSPLEIVKSYAKALKDDGFELILACEKQQDNCKKGYVGNIVQRNYQELIKSRDYGKIPRDTGIWLMSYTHHYLAAKKQAAGEVSYVVVIASDKKNLYLLDTLRVEALEEGNVQITTKVLSDKINTEGKVVLSGIYFETGKNVVTEQSKPSLTTISQYLNDNPAQSFYVVGHTDDTGGLDNNISLSRKRAEAVVESLKEFGVDTSRLSGHGVGPFSPAATNASDKGQGENRRVELVLRVK